MSYPFKVIEKKYDAINGDKYVIETKQCIHCKQTGTVEIFTQEMFFLHKDFREQMITGTHPKCWIEMFGEEE